MPPTLAPRPRQLHIFYRHVHSSANARSRDPNKARPAWFSLQRCFANLLSTLAADPQRARVQLTVMYDSPAELLADDALYPRLQNSPVPLKLQLVDGRSDLNSFRITVAHAYNTVQQPDDLVYLLENDYLHAPGWLSKVFEVFDSGHAFQYVSLYDHKDKYFLAMYQDLQARLYLSANHHWRTAPSTCGSFIFARSTLEADRDALLSGQPDFHLFGMLVGQRRRTLLTPIPGLSTHAMEGYTSPHVDWDAIAAQSGT